MAYWLLKLLGIHAANGAQITHPTIAVRSAYPVALIVLLGVALAAGAVWLYRREADYARPFKRYVMAALRIAFLAMLLVLLLRPVLSFTMENTVRRGLVILVDTSTSMGIKDPRSEAADVKRAAIATDALDPTKGLDQPLSNDAAAKVAQLSRAEVLKAALTNKRLDLLNRLSADYDLKLFAFRDSVDGKGPTTLPAAEPTTAPSTQPTATASAQQAEQWVRRVTPWSPVTPIGDEIRKSVARTRGQPLAGILLLTDGGNNAGSDPVMAAKAARQEGVPIYTYGVGISSPRDVVVADIFLPNEVVFAKDEVPVTVRVKGANLKGETAKLVLKLGDDQVDQTTVTFTGDEQLVPLHLTPQKKGEYELTASIDPRTDETETRNNQTSKHVKVVDEKIKVLFVEQSPRWEFKYLMAQMLRDRRIDLKVWLIDGDPGIAKTENSPYIESFPKTKAELNDKFDVMILGDVDPKKFTAEQLTNISDFVTIAGGGFIMIAGRGYSPNAYVNTPIEKMLPVDLDAGKFFQPSGPNADVYDKPIHMELTPKGARNGMLRLSDKEEESMRRWKELPPIFWAARVGRAKPAAEALLVDPDPARAVRGEKMPIVALQQYKLGQVIFVGTDNTWRWRRNKGDEFYITLWGQMIQRVAMPHLLGSKRTQLAADRKQYAVGDRVTIYARLYDATYEPVSLPTVTGYFQLASGDRSAASERQVALRPVPEQPGMYKGEFVAPAPGNYQFYVDKPAEPDVKLDLAVAEPTVEFGDTAMNEDLLKTIATTTNGEFFREERLYKLPDAIKNKTERVGWPVEVELWSTKLFFLLALSFVSAEWILRKTSQLK